jgi:GxxExxY protein
MEENVLERHEDPLTRAVIGAAIEVHRALGPGLLESAYEACLVHELTALGFAVARQVELPVAFKGLRVDAGYRIDLVVEGSLVIEIKSVEKVLTMHEAQLLTNLRLSKIKTGLILNFNVRQLKAASPAASADAPLHSPSLCSLC